MRSPGLSQTLNSCVAGFSDLDNGPGNGCEHTCEVSPVSVEVCDGKDNDCDGLTDESAELTVPTNFCRQASICSGAQPVCCGAAGWLCDFRSVSTRGERPSPTAASTSRTICALRRSFAAMSA